MAVGHKQVKFNIVLIVLLIVCGIFSPAYCDSEDITLVVRQTPDTGGETVPAAGTYSFEANSEVTLTANPNPGYQFVYWLGDVSSPKSSSTTVTLDQSKVVVAVYNRKDSGTPASGGGMSFGSGSSMPSNVDLYMPSAISPGGGGKTKIVYSQNTAKTPEVPEPATVILLGLGSLAVLKRRRLNNL